MAVRFDAAADRLLDTTTLISMNNPYTVFMFFRLGSNPGANVATLWTANRTGSFTFLDWLAVTNPGSINFSVRVAGSSGTTITGSAALSTATWYAVGLVRSSTTSLAVYYMPVGGSGMIADVENTTNIGARSAALREEIGGLTASNVNPLSNAAGRVMGFKAWQAALSQAELELEALTLRPQRTADLYRWTPLWPGDHTTDYSGNGRTWSEAGLTDEDNPPVGWGGLAAVLVPAVTTYEQAIAGAIEPTGALLRAISKRQAGGITPAGAIARQATKTPAGSITPAGVTRKTTSKLLAGEVEPAGGLVKMVQKLLAGVVEPIGDLVRQAGIFLTGALTPAGSLVKQTAKSLAGVLTPSGLVDAGRTLFQALVGGLQPASSLVKQTAKQVAGALTPDGDVSAIRVLFVALAGALAPVGTLATELVNTLVRLYEIVNGSFTALVSLAGRITTPALRGGFGRSDVEGEVEDD